MSYIYYMYAEGATTGYIGQDSGDTNKLERLCEHIKNAFQENFKDGAARLVRSEGIFKIRYKVFDAPNYGLPEAVFKEFAKQWSYNGKTDFTGQDRLDVAEILHIIRAKLMNNKAAQFNVLVGGFQGENGSAALEWKYSSEDISKTSSKFQKIFNEAKLDGLYETRFKVKVNDDNYSWKKIVFPFAYLALSRIVSPVVSEYLKSESFFTDLLHQDNVTEFFEDYIYNVIKKGLLQKQQSTNADTLYNFYLERFHDIITENLENNVNKKLRSDVNHLLGGTYMKDLQVQWKLDGAVATKILKPIYDRFKQISENMWKKSAQVIVSQITPDGKQVKQVHINGKKFTGSEFLYSFNRKTKTFGDQLYGKIKTKYDAKGLITNFTWTSDALPQWAKTLKGYLGEDVFNKVNGKETICREICKNMFTAIDKVKNKNISFESEDYLYNKVREGISAIGTETKGGQKRDFLHLVISLWHKYKYHEGADWITYREYFDKWNEQAEKDKRETLGKNDRKKSDYDNYIANPQSINRMNPKLVVWYSGKAWAPERQIVENAGTITLEMAGKVLAQNWTWVSGGSVMNNPSDIK